MCSAQLLLLITLLSMNTSIMGNLPDTSADIAPWNRVVFMKVWFAKLALQYGHRLIYCEGNTLDSLSEFELYFGMNALPVVIAEHYYFRPNSKAPRMMHCLCLSSSELEITFRSEGAGEMALAPFTSSIAFPTSSGLLNFPSHLLSLNCTDGKRQQRYSSFV